MPDFEIDPNPGKPKILFIGLGGSTHTHAWIDLLSASDFNVRLFALPDGGIPPADWPVRTYLSQQTNFLPLGLNDKIRKTLFLKPEELRNQQKKISFRLYSFAVKSLLRVAKIGGFPPVQYDPSSLQQKGVSVQDWLCQIIEQWQPDIIHTLGLDPAGYFFYDVYKQKDLQKNWKWILQLRGGSDLMFSRLKADTTRLVSDLVNTTDQIISDNRQNIQYLKEMGVREDQISSLTPVPGTGGINVGELALIRKEKTSKSREIVFPKGYELPWSKCLPVFEAFQLCWDKIAPCRIHILNLTPEIREWFHTLPLEIRESCVLHERVPRGEFFSMLANCRVLLIPSLVDGVPNSLYEAMALGAFPIVSPLETIRSVVEAEKNVLFARNLYPNEIADALVRAMSDDGFVDDVVNNNRSFVLQLADRMDISERVNEYYKKLSDRM